MRPADIDATRYSRGNQQNSQDAHYLHNYLLASNVTFVLTSSPSLKGYPDLHQLRELTLNIDSGYAFLVLADVGLAYPASLGIKTSPLIKAITTSRLHDQENVSLEDLFAAESSIIHAAPKEKDTLRRLHEEFVGCEEQGFAWHYRYWYALALTGEANSHVEQMRKTDASSGQHWETAINAALANR